MTSNHASLTLLSADVTAVPGVCEISLDQRSTWYADPNVPGGEVVLWWLNLAPLLGWLGSSIFVLSLARLSRG